VIALKILPNFLNVRLPMRLAGGLLLVLAGSLPSAAGYAAETGVLHLRCTNATGGASWSMVVDLDHSLVDSLPATISDAWIKWHNASGGIYELERATGKLQLRAASTTGGYFLHYSCQPE
jgi:hypothetical protein